MATSAPAERGRKYTAFVLVALAMLWVLWADERFFFIPADPEWAKIARTGGLLLVHGAFGATALLAGTAQFSTRLRQKPGVHRWTGRVYLGAVTLGATFGLLSGRIIEPTSIFVQQHFQAGLWALTAWIGWWHMRRRNLAQHRLWMMRSYCFCLIFVASRIPDGFAGFHWNDQLLADVLWSLVVVALLLPEWLLAKTR
ncbi:MAG: DUF2306 domain-containing protein [Sphingomonadales bacterium]|nr:DUF2306 domain-containing protein [Sphingomonadales bacterium]